MNFKYNTIRPPTHLAHHVRFFWIFEGGSAGVPYVYRSMADPCAELLFHYRGTFDELSDHPVSGDRGTGVGRRVPSFRSGIHAQTARYRRFVISERFGIVGAYLYPYAVGDLVGVPVSELTDRMPDLASALGAAGRELEERICTAPDNAARVRLLAEFLSQRLSRRQLEKHPVRTLLKGMVDSGKTKRVGDLAQQCNLSERQFERTFRRYAGFSPRQYIRVLRFAAACNHYSTGTRRRLTDIAFDCDYYDQAHFIRDFTTFSGYRPSAYFAGTSEGIEWRDSAPVISPVQTSGLYNS